MRDEIIVYWAPAKFSLEQPSWNLLYPDPQNLYSEMLKKVKKDSQIQRCPAVKDLDKNVFYFYSSISNSVSIPDKLLYDIDKIYIEDQPLPIDAKVALKKVRNSQYDGYANISYNMSWVFFAEEPLVATFTAPYFPAVTPATGALMANGKFDIGQWFRSWNLDYHIPLSCKKFEINKNDPLFFINFETEKKIVFKRFTMTQGLFNIIEESAESTKRYGEKKMSLQERYEMFRQSRSRDIVLREIKKNLID